MKNKTKYQIELKARKMIRVLKQDENNPENAEYINILETRL